MTRKKGLEQAMLPCGLPMAIVGDEKELAIAMEQTGSVSYLLGALPGKKATDMGTPTVFKVVKNLIGYAVVPLDEDDLDLGYVEQHAWFGLPPIPRKIVRDLNAFFRMVDDKLGTESIALLTFDPLYLDQEDPGAGWGVLIPKQTNTAGSCHYDPVSVAEKKEDGVQIVGSVHSHPNMKAFASHTDVGDQANFDGIHITYGWSRGSKFTEYHIELQMGGGRFTFTEKQAFEPEPEAEFDDSVIEWIDAVEKDQPKFNQYQYGQYAHEKVSLPEGVGDPRKAGVIFDVLQGETKCPACDAYLINDDRERRRCVKCSCFLAINGETVDDIRIQRGKGGFSAYELDKTKGDYGAWHVHRKKSGMAGMAVEVDVECLFAAIKTDPGSSGKA